MIEGLGFWLAADGGNLGPFAIPKVMYFLGYQVWAVAKTSPSSAVGWSRPCTWLT